MIKYLKYISKKKKFYIYVRDVIREFKAIVIIGSEKSFLFDDKMKIIDENKHRFYPKTYKIYTELIGEVYKYKKGEGNEEKLVYSFEALENDIKEKIILLEGFEYLSELLTIVLVIASFAQLTTYNALILELLIQLLNLINASTIPILLTVSSTCLTHGILREQRNNNKRSETEEKLKNVYSPLAFLTLKYSKILSEYKWNGIQYRFYFVEFITQYHEIERNYFHIIYSDEKLRWFEMSLEEMYKTSDAYNSDSFDVKKSERDKISGSLKELYSHLIDEIDSKLREVEGNDSLKDSNFDFS